MVDVGQLHCGLTSCSLLTSNQRSGRPERYQWSALFRAQCINAARYNKVYKRYKSITTVCNNYRCDYKMCQNQWSGLNYFPFLAVPCMCAAHTKPRVPMLDRTATLLA